MLSTLVIVRSKGKVRGKGGEDAAGENARSLAPQSHTTFCLNPLMFII